MNSEEIKRIAAVMQEFKLTEFKLESDDLKMAIKRSHPTQNVTVTAPAAGYAPPMSAPPAAAEPPAASAAEAPMGETIDSPIVGTFYAASAPDAPAFVKVGDTVTPETVVCIVEAMKVMNEIKAETSGTVKRILVENATPVEFGQPLIELG
ncbi:MAG: acetyl-CoA carboxylase biotin carboxyl carrier protein [Lentisphaeria bacterium]|nr:acetyl-CoA carboxylase biotin carboxyl carrier protein [Lentisphaeria bacterium]